MSVYLHDIPLPSAQARLQDALRQANLLRVLGTEVIPLDEQAAGRTLAEPVWARLSSPHYHAAAMDVNTACTSFLYGLSSANAMIRTGVVRNAVVIGVEVISPFMDWGNRNVAVLFGDGAAAGADVEHTTAGGDEPAVASRGASVEDLDAVDGTGNIEAADLRALRVIAGVAVRRHDREAGNGIR